jgi:predicted RNA-binding Zn-ribbon protein involved in translation (DUF1610 family)
MDITDFDNMENDAANRIFEALDHHCPNCGDIMIEKETKKLTYEHCNGCGKNWTRLCE